MGYFVEPCHYDIIKPYRYSIHQIDEKRKKIKIVEKGMAFLLSFDDLHAHLHFLKYFSPQDAFVLGYILSKHKLLEKIKLDNLQIDRAKATLLLESEGRRGRFKFYDSLARKTIDYNIIDLLANESDFLRIDYHDIFQIGISSGRNQHNANLLKQLFMWRAA